MFKSMSAQKGTPYALLPTVTKWKAKLNQTSSSTISSSLSFASLFLICDVMPCRYVESTGDVSGCRSKACLPVWSWVLSQEKVKQLLFCREYEGLTTCGVSSSLDGAKGLWLPCAPGFYCKSCDYFYRNL